MKAVIVGAGAAGVLHALAFRAAGVEIAAVYDPDEERARALSDACGGRVLGSLAAAVAADAPIAAVCSPPSAHVEQAEALSVAGRTVFVEKPVATTPRDLERLRALPRCVPILQWRAGRALRALRRAIAHGELGDAPVASCDLDWARDEAYVRARGASWGCGALLSVGIHAVDALAWALGREIEGVCGLTTARAGAHAETAAVGLFRFAGGAAASLRISLDGGGDTTRITVSGRGVTAHLEGSEADPTARALVWSAESDAARARLEALEKDTPGGTGAPLLVPYLGAAIEAIREGAAPGDTERLPSIGGTASAHAAAMRIAARGDA